VKIGRHKIKIGDCFRIPLADGRFAYCQYVYQHREFGYLVRVFDKITSEPFNTAETLQTAIPLVPPVFVGLRASVRSGRWKNIGNIAVRDFAFAKFRITMGTKPAHITIGAFGMGLPHAQLETCLLNCDRSKFNACGVMKHLRRE